MPELPLADLIKKVSYRGASVVNRLRRGQVDTEVVYEDEDRATYVRSTAQSAMIEPRFGYVMSPRGVLLDSSLETNFSSAVPSWRLGTPSPLAIRRAIRSSEHTAEYEAIISLRHWYEWNYYHFIMDVLGKLELFDSIGLGADIPIALGWYPHQLSFVREAIARGELKDRTWLIPDVDDESAVFHARRIYFCRTRQPYGQRIAYLHRLLGTPLPQPESEERIFLTRRPPHGRRLVNDAEVEAYLHDRGFQTVDSAQLDLQEQMELFSRVRYLVAQHGAGTTNIIFRRGAPLSVLELHSYRYGGLGDMVKISDTLGFHYAHLAGPAVQPREDHANFTIDMTDLRAAVDEMLRH